MFFDDWWSGCYESYIMIYGSHSREGKSVLFRGSNWAEYMQFGLNSLWVQQAGQKGFYVVSMNEDVLGH